MAQWLMALSLSAGNLGSRPKRRRQGELVTCPAPANVAV